MGLELILSDFYKKNECDIILGTNTPFFLNSGIFVFLGILREKNR